MPTKASISNRKWRQKNRDKTREYSRKYRVTRRDKINEYNRKYRSKREAIDASFKIRQTLRRRMYMSLIQNQKSGSALDLLGCSIPDFKIYIESKWESGMSWDNYGKKGWHIDHIMPCAIFDLSKPEHQKRCFHFSNLQPMWASTNHRKSAKVHTNQFNLL